jgi:8-oxo-dGTP diphosphatase
MVTFKQKSVSCLQALDLPKPKAPNIPVVLVSACALIDRDKRVLLAQRPKGKAMEGLWEFPGGKVDDGETPEYALMRELEEELDIQTRPCSFFPVAFASHSYEEFHLLMPLFTCRVWKGTIVPKEGQSLKWVSPTDIYKYSMPEADLPLVDQLIQVI